MDDLPYFYIYFSIIFLSFLQQVFSIMFIFLSFKYHKFKRLNTFKSHIYVFSDLVGGGIN